MLRLFLLLLFTSVVLPQEVLSEAPRFELHPIMVGREKRDYLLYQPKSYSPKTATSIVLVVPSVAMTELQTDHITALSELASAEGFTLVYARAQDRFWDDARLDRKIALRTTKSRDIAYLQKLVSLLTEKIPEGHRKVYLLGISDGGMMALRLVCEASHMFTAAAIVNATLPRNVAYFCSGEAMSTPILIVGGGKDPVFTRDGYGGPFRGKFSGITESFPNTNQRLLELNSCKEHLPEELVPSSLTEGATKLRVFRYHGCSHGKEHGLIMVEEGGHRWPGGQARQRSEDYVTEVLGPRTQQFDATKAVWKYFQGGNIVTQ